MEGLCQRSSLNNSNVSLTSFATRHCASEYDVCIEPSRWVEILSAQPCALACLTNLRPWVFGPRFAWTSQHFGQLFICSSRGCRGGLATENVSVDLSGVVPTGVVAAWVVPTWSGGKVGAVRGRPSISGFDFSKCVLLSFCWGLFVELLVTRNTRKCAFGFYSLGNK